MMCPIFYESFCGGRFSMLGSNRARAFEREKKGRGLPQSFFSKRDPRPDYLQASSMATVRSL
jgi:hypothetical protein